MLAPDTGLCSLNLLDVQGYQHGSCLWNGNPGWGHKEPSSGVKLAYQDRQGLDGEWQKVRRQTRTKCVARSVDKSSSSQPGCSALQSEPKVEESSSDQGSGGGCIKEGGLTCKYQGQKFIILEVWLSVGKPLRRTRFKGLPVEGSLARAKLEEAQRIPMRAYHDLWGRSKKVHAIF